MSKKIYFWIALFPLILSLIITIIILVFFRFLPPKLPLFYSLLWGEEQLATPQQFLIIPASISAVALLNLIISWQLHSSQVFFKKILPLTSIVVSLIMVIALFKITLNFI